MTGIGFPSGIGLGGKPTNPGTPGTGLPPVSNTRLNQLASQIAGAVNKIEIANGTITFTTVGGTTQTETLPSGFPANLTAEQITEATNHGEAPDSGSLAGLASGWWYIPPTTDAPNLKGRPPKVVDKGVLYKQIVTDSNGDRRGVMMYYGKNTKGEPTLWIRFKTNSVFGNWTEFPNAAAQVASMDALVQAVKTQVDADKLVLASLQQQVTDLTAEVNKDKLDLTALKGKTIPSIADIQSHLTSLGWGPITKHLTTQMVQAALVAKGWGPLPAQITVDTVKDALVKQGWGPVGRPKPEGGGQQPSLTLPKIWVLFGNGMPKDLTSAVTSTTGTVHLHRASSQLARLWVLVESDVAAKVKSIQVGSTLASRWDTRTVTIDGQQYSGFYSAGGFTVLDEPVTVKFGG